MTTTGGMTRRSRLSPEFRREWDEAEKEGREAYDRGVGSWENPHAGVLAEAWMTGWRSRMPREENR